MTEYLGGEVMKQYTLKDYISALEKENLIECVPSNIDISNIENTLIEKVTHNSKEVTNNTLYICNGLNYKPSYLEEAIQNGAIFSLLKKKM